MCFAPQRRTLFRHLNFQKWSKHGELSTFWLGNVLRPTTACTFSTSQLPKVVRTCSVFTTLTWKCASRHNAVHFFDISTSKSGPRMVGFWHFWLGNYFAPQRRTLFRHLNFQKWSKNGGFLTLLTWKLVRATTAYTFSTSQLPKVVQAWWAFYILTWKCASPRNAVHFFDISTSKNGPYMWCVYHFDLETTSRHNGVHFFDISTSKSGPRMVGFWHFWLGNSFAPQRRTLFRHLNFQKWSKHGELSTFWLGNVLRPATRCTFSTSQLPKIVRTCGAFTILTWKCASRQNAVHFFDISTSKSGLSMVRFLHFDLEMCFAPQPRALCRLLNFQKWSKNVGFLTLLTWKFASRHNGVHFFDISTSKSAPMLVCFYHFDLEMCFVPQQRRTLFRHFNFQKCSDVGVLLPFWLGNVPRATTACTFSTAQLPKALRCWCVFYILTWKCASRQNGVHFFMSHLASWLRARRFSEVTFSTLRSHKSLEKHSESRLPYLFVHLHLVSSDFPHLLSSHFLTSPLWLFPLLFFHLCILSEVWLLNFLRQELKLLLSKEI